MAYEFKVLEVIARERRDKNGCHHRTSHYTRKAVPSVCFVAGRPCGVYEHLLTLLDGHSLCLSLGVLYDLLHQQLLPRRTTRSPTFGTYRKE